jgi:3-methyladenine DNA glycosylase AlkD
MFHSANAVIAALKRLARPAGEFDASRYFRGEHDLGFYNVGTSAVRALARQIAVEHRGLSTIDDAMKLADALIADRYLETKAVAIELVARYRRDFTPALLPRWKRWLENDYSSNWATTDGICGALIGRLLLEHPELAGELASWSVHRNLWVRRASVVALIPLARKGGALDLLYANARRLHTDPHDLIHKAVGWALREAGKADGPRLERYLRANGPAMPRTTVRYAIERFAPATRRRLLAETRAGGAGRAGRAGG